MIVDHDSEAYRKRWNRSGADRWNGAFYYSKEIKANIIPNVETDRNWVLVNQQGEGFDHSIVFIHNNLHPDHYEWLSRYDDLVLVCGVPATCAKVAHLGRAVYLPLSVDVEYVRQFSRAKTKGTAFAGRPAKCQGVRLQPGTDILTGLPRTKLLPRMARYRRVYAVGRTAIEARVLGCEVLAYDSRFPDPSIWKVVDNLEAAAMLQEMLDGIDA